LKRIAQGAGKVLYSTEPKIDFAWQAAAPATTLGLAQYPTFPHELS
jgi:hypothetical protein